MKNFLNQLKIYWKRWIDHLRAFLRTKEAFTYWVGFGAPPFLFGMIPVGFTHTLFLGVMNLIIVGGFVYYTVNMTCRRCPFYGTHNCPVPGKILPFLLPKLKDTTIPLHKVKEHYYVDLLMITYANLTYALFCKPLWPIVFIGTLGALIIVYIPKRHHGLLYRLKN